MKPEIGLMDKNRDAVVRILNTTLADEMVLLTKTRNYHWNVVGPQFNDLHKFFDAQYEELNEILESAVEGLAPPYRTVFVLRDIEDLSTEETAEALNLSIPAVKSRLLRARLQLRDKLTRYFKRKGEDAFAYL